MGRHDVLEVMERLREHTTIFYCTHILDDVQRVSDTVAILNHGQLIAAGSIAELLSTDQGGVAYEVGLKGEHGRDLPPCRQPAVGHRDSDRGRQTVRSSGR